MKDRKEIYLEAEHLSTFAALEYYAPMFYSQQNQSRPIYEATLSNLFRNAPPPGVTQVPWNQFYVSLNAGTKRVFPRMMGRWGTWWERRLLRPTEFVFPIGGHGWPEKSRAGEAPWLPLDVQELFLAEIYSEINSINYQASLRGIQKTGEEIFLALDFPRRFTYPTPPGAPHIGLPSTHLSTITVHLPEAVSADHKLFRDWYSHLKQDENSSITNWTPDYLKRRFAPDSPFIDLEIDQDIPSDIQASLENDAISFLAHQSIIHCPALRDLLVRHTVVPTHSQNTKASSTKGSDDAKTVAVFARVIEFRLKVADAASRSGGSRGGAAPAPATDGGSWTSCGNNQVYEFKLTADGSTLLENYKNAHLSRFKTLPTATNYIAPPIYDALDQYPALVVMEDSSPEERHLYQLRKTNPDAYENLDQAGYEAIKAANRAKHASCSMFNCIDNENTLDGDGNILRFGLNEDTVTSPTNDSEFACPHHFDLLRVLEAEGLNDYEAKRVIGWKNLAENQYSLSRKLAFLYRCPFGCDHYFGQMRTSLTPGADLGDLAGLSALGVDLNCQRTASKDLKKQKAAMEKEVKAFEAQKKDWTRKDLTPFRAVPMKIKRSSICAESGCSRLLKVVGTGRSIHYLSLDGDEVCAPHFLELPHLSVPEAQSGKYKKTSISAQDASQLIAALVAAPVEQTICDFARQRRVLPSAIWAALLKLAKGDQRFLLDAAGWDLVKDVFGPVNT